jgi:dihydrofolate synthase/folylpolyglutamate synthase
VRNGFAFVDWPGRFQIFPGEPTLILDVAHNPHSVSAMVANLDAMSYHPRTHAVLGAMADKDIRAMLQKAMPVIDAWYVCDLPTPRAASAASLQSSLEHLVTQQPNSRQERIGFPQISQHKTPSNALRMALAAADSTDRIIVFGSFYTVGGIIADGIPHRNAKHTS